MDLRAALESYCKHTDLSIVPDLKHTNLMRSYVNLYLAYRHFIYNHGYMGDFSYANLITIYNVLVAEKMNHQAASLTCLNLHGLNVDAQFIQTVYEYFEDGRACIPYNMSVMNNLFQKYLHNTDWATSLDFELKNFTYDLKSIHWGTLQTKFAGNAEFAQVDALMNTFCRQLCVLSANNKIISQINQIQVNVHLLPDAFNYIKFMSASDKFLNIVKCIYCSNDNNDIDIEQYKSTIIELLLSVST